MWSEELRAGAIPEKDSKGTAATPSAPQTNPIVVLNLAVRLSKESCSSGVKVNPHGLRPFVLYFSITDKTSFN
jgi:hypothetical protein